MKAPILGGAYQARSSILAADRCVNLFSEAAPSPPGKDAGALFACPGLREKAAIASTTGVMGLKAANGFLYAVIGGYLYEIDTDYTATSIGAVGAVQRVTMAENGIELIISTGYLYTFATSTLSQITDAGFPAGNVDFMDGYFLSNLPDSDQFQISSLYDGSVWDGLDFASAEGSPDDVIGHIVSHREWWLFGTNSVEIWYNSGDTDFPFSRISGAFIEVGCAAKDSIAKLDNSVFWLGQDERGHGQVWRAIGYNPQRISTHAIEYAISSYTRIDDAYAFAYQQEGHGFYCLNFPSAEKTWVYDVSTGLWHERANFAGGEFTRWRANCHAFFNGKHVVGDYESGQLYELDMDYHTNGTEVKKWLRSFRLPSSEGDQVRVNSFQLDMQVGNGLTTGQGSDPQVMLRYSKDGGRTWSEERTMATGAIGEYSTRVISRRLGVGRDWVIEVSGTDPVPCAIVAGYIR